MPLVVQLEFADGTKEMHRIPAEIWLKNQKQVTKIFQSTKDLKRVTLDPYLETADVNRKNNYWPQKMEHVYMPPGK